MPSVKFNRGPVLPQVTRDYLEHGWAALARFVFLKAAVANELLSVLTAIAKTADEMCWR